MEEKRRKTPFYKNTSLILFVIGIIVLFVFPRFFNDLEERRLNNSGITTYGQIIGIWQISEQRSMAIYMFPIDSIYHTGRFGFPREYNIHKGDGVRVVYLENRPNISRALEVLPVWRDLCNSSAVEYSKQEKYSQINE
jgi:hypothetical protein